VGQPRLMWQSPLVRAEDRTATAYPLWDGESLRAFCGRSPTDGAECMPCALRETVALLWRKTSAFHIGLG
jgi:hypothetical protein